MSETPGRLSVSRGQEQGVEHLVIRAKGHLDCVIVQDAVIDDGPMLDEQPGDLDVSVAYRPRDGHAIQCLWATACARDPFAPARISGSVRIGAGRQKAADRLDVPQVASLVQTVR